MNTGLDIFDYYLEDSFELYVEEIIENHIKEETHFSQATAGLINILMYQKLSLGQENKLMWLSVY